MTKVIIDTDIGVDDAVALRYALLTQDVIGFTCTYGNVRVNQAVKNAHYLVAHYKKDIPVFKGASKPLVREPLAFSGKIHGNDGLGDYFDNKCKDDADNAIDFILKSAYKYGKDLTIVTIGPLTNLAIALNLEPNLPHIIGKVVCMGGAFGSKGHSGNMSQFAEFNIICDPEAASLVFNAPFDLTVVPLDVTHQVLITRQQIKSLNDDFITNMSDFYLNYSEQSEGFAGMCVHDAMTIEYLLNEKIFTVEECSIDVSTTGITDGQTVRSTTNYNVPYDKFKNKPKHKVCLDVNVNKAVEMLLQTLQIT